MFRVIIKITKKGSSAKYITIQIMFGHIYYLVCYILICMFSNLQASNLIQVGASDKYLSYAFATMDFVLFSFSLSFFLNGEGIIFTVCLWLKTITHSPEFAL